MLNKCQAETPLTLNSAQDALSLYNRTKICMAGNIPAGQLWAHVGVNVNLHWLTLITENNFTRTSMVA